jgi:nucleotide-binding universal stress UspA family protein
MYQHIMVPLDGSELAECVLSHVEMLAKSYKIPKITLIRVVTPLKLYSGLDYGGFEASLSGNQIQRLEDDNIKIANEYLAKQVSRLTAQGINAEPKVVFGMVSDELSAFAEKNNVDLIVIATHGRSGITRWVWGSVADKILKTSKVPVLMVRPDSCGLPGQ